MSNEHTGNLLICNATMILPDETIIGDLRVEQGIIAEIAPGGGLEPKDGEHVIDATGFISFPVPLTRKFTSENRVNQKKKTSAVVLLPLSVEASPRFWTCQTTTLPSPIWRACK